MLADRDTGSRLQLHGMERLPRLLIRHSRRKKEPEGFPRAAEALQLDESKTQGSVVRAEEVLRESTSSLGDSSRASKQ